jgi:hypothetical protein
MAREFICYHCCAIYTGTLPLGATTTCDHCCEEFVVLQFRGHQECWKRKGGILGFAVDFAVASAGLSLAGFKLVCPACGKRESCQKIGEKHHEQRVIRQRWHNCWTDFYCCLTCRVTWCYHQSSEA